MLFLITLKFYETKIYSIIFEIISVNNVKWSTQYRYNLYIIILYSHIEL